MREQTVAEANGIGDEGQKTVKSPPVTNGGAGSLPTVRIHHDDHPNGLIINESDFNPKKQRLFGEPEPDEDDDDDAKGGDGAGAPAGGGTPLAGNKPPVTGTKGGAKGKGK